jgi:SOS regulatory protein LexA
VVLLIKISMYQDYKKKILSFYGNQKRMPSYTEIMKLVGYKSKNAVAKLVDKLVEEGIVTKDAAGKLIPTFNVGEVPLLGVIEAGIPTVADAQELNTISLDNYLVGDKTGDTFLLEVKGDSMIEAHIEEGDYVIAVRTENPKVDDIVVAEVDGEWTLKYFKKEGDMAYLLPANKNYAPIYPAQSLRIAAVVTGVIRKYK